MRPKKYGKKYTGKEGTTTDKYGNTVEDFGQYYKDMKGNPYAPGLDRVKNTPGEKLLIASAKKPKKKTTKRRRKK